MQAAAVRRRERRRVKRRQRGCSCRIPLKVSIRRTYYVHYMRPLKVVGFPFCDCSRVGLGEKNAWNVDSFNLLMCSPHVTP